MYRVIDSITFETLFIGNNEDECVNWIIENNVANCFIEKYR